MIIEIAIIFVLSKAISRNVKSKGYKSGWFVVMLIALWFAGETGGAFVGIIIGMISTGGRTASPGGPYMLIVYLCALIGAAAGAGTAFSIVRYMPPQRPRFDEEELEEANDYDLPAPSPPAGSKDQGQYYDPQVRRIPPPPGSGPIS